MNNVRKTHSKFLEDLKQKNIDVYNSLEFLGEYKKDKEKILAKDKYGEIYVTPSKMLLGRTPTIQSAVNKHSYFLNILKEKNPIAYNKLKFLDEYKNNREKLLVSDKYGKMLVTPNNLLNGQNTGIKASVDKTVYFINRAIEVHGAGKYGYKDSVYKKKDEKLKIFCKKCNSIFLQTPDCHVNSEHGCPNCQNYKGEKRVREYLRKSNILFRCQESFLGCKDKNRLSFDFYLPTQNTCIEYDGEQHFKPVRFGGRSLERSKEALKHTKRKDFLKDTYCFLNNIKLIRIPYWEFNNIEECLNVKQ